MILRSSLCKLQECVMHALTNTMPVAPLCLQFYRDYDRALNTYMSVDSGIGMDLTLVRHTRAAAGT
jgi:hypothetical protein